MIVIKFKTRDSEIDFFKKLHEMVCLFGFKIKYAEMVSDLDAAEREKDQD